MGTLYFCCDERRRNEVAQSADVNGIDFLEVLDEPGQALTDRQRTLFVHFVKPPTGLVLPADKVTIVGGERIRDVEVLAVAISVDPRSGSSDPLLVVEVDGPGDFSVYTLRLGPGVPGLDPVLTEVDFSFKVNCETKFDPLEHRTCPPKVAEEPALDYLARDFPTLRQLLFDRLAVVAPEWEERNAADAGSAVVELLAYMADQLAYRQDAVATEAYLGTCRLRTSAKRHARLVDYQMHDGCNARAWVHVQLRDGTPPFLLRQASFYSAVPGIPAVVEPGSAEETTLRTSGTTGFELLSPNVLLAPEHNEMRFYTWGARECCLPEGAVGATLRGGLPDLAPGMVLVLEEVASPRTGDPDDADLSRRHAVLLTEVTHRVDPLGGRFDEEPTNDPLEVTEIRWAEEDALPFPLCISAEIAEEFGGGFADDVSVARGNVVLADHGSWFPFEDLGTAPTGGIRHVLPASEADPDTGTCRPSRDVVTPARFRPRLARGPLTQAVPYDPADPPPSARAATRYAARDALAAIELREATVGDAFQPWEVRLDLLSSRSTDTHFVVDVESDGRGRIRFGDGEHGRRQTPGARFSASYRVGNGAAGNVGAGTLVHVVTADDGIAAVTNPIPASGGIEMETIEEVRQYAPIAFRPQTLPGEPSRPDGHTLRRAVTPDDYAAVLETFPGVQRAAATFRWTGSWRTVSLAVDRVGGRAVDEAFEEQVGRYVEEYRLAGHDVEVEPPEHVALEIAIDATVVAGYFVSEVRRALLDVFSNRVLPDGRRGVFHPDNLTFHQTIYLSPLYAAALAVDGVESVDVTLFQRRDRPGPAALEAGRLALGRREIARLDNDPNFPERGTFTVRVVSR